MLTERSVEQSRSQMWWGERGKGLGSREMVEGKGFIMGW